MRKKIINFDDVRKIALGLPGVKEDSAFGGRAFKAGGKLLACTPTNRSAEPGSLGVRIDVNDRAHLLAEAPDVYYVTEHYVPYPMVLVRLSRITPDVLRDLLRMAHKFVTAKPKSRRRPPAATRS
ncbi:MAG: MmcQ/YjbR family DNA-binding protein [Candidatus Acidiferrales bacterium]